MFVYIVDRDGELDVYEDLDDAREACEILGTNEFGDPYTYQEQVVFRSAWDDTDTQRWLLELRQGKEN